MTQDQYTTIIKCITFGSPAQADELIKAINKLVSDAQEVEAKSKVSATKAKEPSKKE